MQISWEAGKQEETESGVGDLGYLGKKRPSQLQRENKEDYKDTQSLDKSISKKALAVVKRRSRHRGTLEPSNPGPLSPN